MSIKRSKEIFSDANRIEVEVSTTGYKGGDAGHGGETCVVLTDMGGTTWNLEATSYKGFVPPFEELRSVRLVVRGDAELRTLGKSLSWAGEKILALANDAED